MSSESGVPAGDMGTQRPPGRTRHCDAVVLGSGVAGLSAALALEGLDTVVVTKGPLHASGSTALAQGGVAAAVAEDDTPDLHAEDTLQAGGGLADPDRVRLLTLDAPRRIEALQQLGAGFDRNADGGAALGREAMHSAARILHAHGDRTGREILRALVRAVGNLPRLSVEEGTRAVQLIQDGGRVCGVRGVDGEGIPVVIHAEAVILATGGPGRLYRRTTNPPDATGDGVAMAARAGAALADLEFVQFHPTALSLEDLEEDPDPLPLVSEAVRGEGALLVDARGRRIMEGHHRRMELAPRDVVARAIGMARAEGHAVYLDARERPGASFPQRFPGIFRRCREAGIDPRNDLIPVAPAEHFHMGGVATDDTGRTSLPGLWACGEVAATGVHGANRLASNSLLEGLVFGSRAGRDVRSGGSTAGWNPPSNGVSARGNGAWASADSLTGLNPSGAPLPFSSRMACEGVPTVHELRAAMDRWVGLVRDEGGLERAISLMARGLEASSHGPDRHDGLLRNSALLGYLVASAALWRRESRGAHFRSDYPASRDEWAHRRLMTAPAALRARLEETPAARGMAPSGARGVA